SSGSREPARVPAAAGVVVRDRRAATLTGHDRITPAGGGVRARSIDTERRRPSRDRPCRGPTGRPRAPAGFGGGRRCRWTRGDTAARGGRVCRVADATALPGDDVPERRLRPADRRARNPISLAVHASPV